MALAQLTNALLLNVASCAAEIHGRPRSTQAHGKNRVPFLAATCVGAPTLHHRNVALCVGSAVHEFIAAGGGVAESRAVSGALG